MRFFFNINLAVFWLAFLTACSPLSSGGSAQQFYVLNDDKTAVTNVASENNAPPLLIYAKAASSFYDSTRLAYGRHESARAYYQFANWTTRPATRLAQLLVHRLNAQGEVNAALFNSDLGGEWLLDIRLDDFYHDVSQQPSQVRLVIQANLIRRSTQKIAASRTFRLSALASSTDATGAVAAFQTASTQWLDEMTIWLNTAKK